MTQAQRDIRRKLRVYREGRCSALANLTPLKAIRKFCLACVVRWAEVEKCTGKMLYEPDCPKSAQKGTEKPQAIPGVG